MVIKVENLFKNYGDLTAVNNLNLEIKEGEIFGLLGPNGSGKTTTINCILSLLNYKSGNIKIFNKPMKPDSYEIKREIGVIMQEVAVFDELTVFENIDYFCGLYINKKNEKKDLVDQAIEFVKLNDFRKYLPKQLSGGLLRRLNIACGIAHKPKLIFFDEPTVGVDPQSRNNILEGIQNLNSQGATIVYTSHYMEEVEQICARVCILDKGSVIALGSKEDLKNNLSVCEKFIVEAFDLNQGIISEIENLPNILAVTLENGKMHVNFGRGEDNSLMLLEFLKDKNIKIRRIYSEIPTLNDVFLELTGKELRD